MRCDKIGWKIERALIPYQPISIGPVHSSDMLHFTICLCTGQSAGSARVATVLQCFTSCKQVIFDDLVLGLDYHADRRPDPE